MHCNHCRRSTRVTTTRGRVTSTVDPPSLVRVLSNLGRWCGLADGHLWIAPRVAHEVVIAHWSGEFGGTERENDPFVKLSVSFVRSDTHRHTRTRTRARAHTHTHTHTHTQHTHTHTCIISDRFKKQTNLPFSRDVFLLPTRQSVLDGSRRFPRRRSSRNASWISNQCTTSYPNTSITLNSQLKKSMTNVCTHKIPPWSNTPATISLG